MKFSKLTVNTEHKGISVILQKFRAKALFNIFYSQVKILGQKVTIISEN